MNIDQGHSGVAAGWIKSFGEEWRHEPMDFWAGGKHWQECQDDREIWPCAWKRSHDA